MTALYIILGIIAFFVILLSIKFAVTVHYEDDVAVSVKWLFLKFDILPKKEKEEKALRRSRKRAGICQYCGHHFKGFFKKTCSYCGKAKDY